MIKLKRVADIICPKCGKNEPVFLVEFELRGWPLGELHTSDDIETYDIDIENDFGYMATTMDETIRCGKAICKCCNCGTEIKYYEEIENETECCRSSK